MTRRKRTEEEATPRPRYNISPEDFIVAWMRSDSVDQVREVLSDLCKQPVSKSAVLSRAEGYRRLGLNLKKMPRKPNNKLNLEALAKLIEAERVNKTGEPSQSEQLPTNQ